MSAELPVECPKCGKLFEPFLRGQVVRFGWFGLRKKVFCLICWACKEIVGYEDVAGNAEWKPARSPSTDRGRG